MGEHMREEEVPLILVFEIFADPTGVSRIEWGGFRQFAVHGSYDFLVYITHRQ
jgi:hypothetical protein